MDRIITEWQNEIRNITRTHTSSCGAQGRKVWGGWRVCQVLKLAPQIVENVAVGFHDFISLLSPYNWIKWNNSRFLVVREHSALPWETGKKLSGVRCFERPLVVNCRCGGIWMEILSGHGEREQWTQPFRTLQPTGSIRRAPAHLVQKAVLKRWEVIYSAGAAFWRLCAQSKRPSAWGNTLFFKYVSFMRKWKNLDTLTFRSTAKETNVERQEERCHIYTQPLQVKCLHYFTEISQQPHEWRHDHPFPNEDQRTEIIDQVNTTGRRHQLLFIWLQSSYLCHIYCFPLIRGKGSLLSLLSQISIVCIQTLVTT